MAFILGVDLGEKRIGIAIADDVTKIATPLKTIIVHNRKELLAGISKLVTEYHSTKIVVGLPKTLKGDIGPAAQKIMETVDWLKTQLSQQDWVFWDERLSSQEVERILLEADLSRERRKEVRDQLAAQRILQNYLDFHRNVPS